MAKDPAFLFYPGDWLGGTMGMSFEEKGAYFELLMLQFNRGHMTSQVIGQAVGQLWDNIKDKFTQDEAGLWYNKRLETEKNNRKTFTKSRNNNLLGTNQHTKKGGHKGGHTSSRMENEDINENENRDLDEIKDRGLGKGNLIVPQMCKVWYGKFPTYTSDKQNDFEGMGKILQFIYRNAPNPKDIQESSTQEKIINTLHLISDQVEKDNFWVNKPIKSIASHIQEFYNKIKNPVNGNSKSANGKVTGEQLNTSFAKFYNKGK